MRRVLTTALLLIGAMTATAADTPMEEVVVTGEYAAASGSASTKNESTIAFVQMDDLLGEHGYLESLRKRGYQILAPG